MDEPVTPCVFCEIAAGREGAGRVLFEDEHTIAFLDHTAVMPGHTLVVPRIHAADLWEISAGDAAAVMRTVHLMAARIRDVLRPDGLTLFQANRSAGWQDVFHLHVHLVPRSADDHLARPWVAAPKSDAELAAVRALLVNGHRTPPEP
ncbi:histidine triad (HIT) family protein [Amycolatopsis xylanica]|uniref:Histidine triad (HIT) family protein n=1 Tax=Amycolatopsis xylanica TaxID=589385 RepID=A0A1H3PHZ0_9PSEU|nr:HIT domain-containing protein [Amycolatopsis xylanica]SDZ00677.1 histidine triad (HIT) family protein [Amycolatopsis xylanica]